MEDLIEDPLESPHIRVAASQAAGALRERIRTISSQEIVTRAEIRAAGMFPPRPEVGTAEEFDRYRLAALEFFREVMELLLIETQRRHVTVKGEGFKFLKPHEVAPYELEVYETQAMKQLRAALGRVAVAHTAPMSPAERAESEAAERRLVARRDFEEKARKNSENLHLLPMMLELAKGKR